ncbi:hypothetical protein DSUL_50268 [Desulfovibrionales bacterium]
MAMPYQPPTFSVPAKTTPAYLRCTATIEVDTHSTGRINPGEYMRIVTGGNLPTRRRRSNNRTHSGTRDRDH